MEICYWKEKFATNRHCVYNFFALYGRITAPLTAKKKKR